MEAVSVEHIELSKTKGAFALSDLLKNLFLLWLVQEWMVADKLAVK